MDYIAKISIGESSWTFKLDFVKYIIHSFLGVYLTEEDPDETQRKYAPYNQKVLFDNIAKSEGIEAENINFIVHIDKSEIVYEYSSIPGQNRKDYFSKKIHTENEGDISSKSVMELMKDMIEKEIIPLSDDEIMKNLRSKGIKIARRTISKYRQQLKILPSYLRKK